MKRWTVRLAGVAAAAVVSTGLLVTTAGVASAESCAAPSGKACVLLKLQTTSVKSIRVDGQCLYLRPLKSGETHSDQYFGNGGVVGGVATGGTPNLRTYSAEKCGGTDNTDTKDIGTNTKKYIRWAGQLTTDRFRSVIVALCRDTEDGGSDPATLIRTCT